MKKYNIISDTHLYSYPLKGVDYEEIVRLGSLDNTVLLGDIIDVKNSKKKEVYSAELTRDFLLHKVGERYVTGNHEVSTEHINYIDGEILFTHGDIPLWGLERAMDARGDEAGKGFLIRIFKKIFFPIELSKKLDKEEIEGCYEYLKETEKKVGKYLSTIVVGHKHPRKLIDIEYKGRRIIVVPRGITELELNHGR